MNRRDRQYKDSALLCFIGFLGMIIIVSVLCIISLVYTG